MSSPNFRLFSSKIPVPQVPAVGVLGRFLKLPVKPNCFWWFSCSVSFGLCSIGSQLSFDNFTCQDAFPDLSVDNFLCATSQRAATFSKQNSCPILIKTTASRTRIWEPFKIQLLLGIKNIHLLTGPVISLISTSFELFLNLC